MKNGLRQNIFNLKSEGKGNYEIACELKCSLRTVQRCVKESSLQLASVKGYLIDKAFKEFAVTETSRIFALALNLRKVEEELATRTYASIPTAQLQKMASKLRGEAQKLDDLKDKRIEDALIAQDLEFGTEDTMRELGETEDTPSASASQHEPASNQTTPSTSEKPSTPVEGTTQPVAPVRKMPTILPTPEAQKQPTTNPNPNHDTHHPLKEKAA
jgi:hypothetical protein